MAEQNEKLLLELLKIDHNSECADCGSKAVEWASYNIGIFLCTRCAAIHRSIGAHISKVKHLKLDRWDDSQVERMREVGNVVAKMNYEKNVPVCYRIPTAYDSIILLEQWIRGKYERMEFSHVERPIYTQGYMEGFLMKRGKEDSRYQPRNFVLDESKGILKYYVKESKDPKAIIRLIDLNASFAPPKMELRKSMQISFMTKDNVTRHIFVYHDEPDVIVNWYMAIRCSKMHRMIAAYPLLNEVKELSVVEDFVKEGWLCKTGPRPSDNYKKRWFTLDGRKLMYHDDPMDAYAKGEIFIGEVSDDYAVRPGVAVGAKDQDYSFSLITPSRTYNFSAATSQERDEWIHTIKKVLNRPINALDLLVCERLAKSQKRSKYKS